MSETSTKAALEASGVHTERVFVDAEMARRFIRKNVVNNRPINETRKKEFIRDMKAGRWKENGSTIVFTKDDELIDGQHRLQACIEGGVGFWTLIARNVDRDAFLTIDRGQVRSTGQMLHLATGLKDYNSVSGVLTYLYRFRDGIMLQSGRPTTSEAEELLRMNPGIPEAVAAARGVAARGFKAGPPAVIGLCYYLFTRQDMVLAEAFFDALGTGASLREVDPVYQLRTRIISASSSGKHIGTHELFALIFKAWLAEREKRTMKQSLRWSMAESFPNIGPIESIHKIKIPQPAPGKSHPGRRRAIKVIPDVPVEKVQPPVNPPESKLDQLIKRHHGLDNRRA